jgi:hypothetical protein
MPQAASASDEIASVSRPATAMKAVFMVPEAVTRTVRASRETAILSAEMPFLRSAVTSSLPRFPSWPSVAAGASFTRARAVASTAR